MNKWERIKGIIHILQTPLTWIRYFEDGNEIKFGNYQKMKIWVE